MDQSVNDLLLGSIELPDFINGAFWFDSFGEKLDASPQIDARSAAADEALTKEDSDPDSYHPSEYPAPPTARRRRGRGRAKSNLSAEERRLKNREIQARYRAKQRSSRSELETAHTQASDDLEKARGENDIAKERNVMLEKLLVVKDVSVDILQGKGKVELSSVSSEEAPKKKAGHVIVETGDSGTTGDTGRSSDSNSVPQPVVHSLYQTFSIDLGGPVTSIADAYVAAERLHEEHGDLAVKYPHYAEIAATVKTMTGHQLVQGWRSFTLQLRSILEEHERELTNGVPACNLHWSWGNPPQVLMKIVPLFEEQVVILSTALRHNLQAVQALFDTAGEVEDPSTFWRNVAKEIQITPLQRNKLMAMSKGYDSRVASLRAQRIDVVESLRHATTPGKGGCPVENLHVMMEKYLTLFDTSGKLAATPDSELLALIELMQNTGSVWTMLQRAKMVALAYPVFPDTVMFVKAVAEMSVEELCGEATRYEQENAGPSAGSPTGLEVGRVAVGTDGMIKPPQ